MAARARRVKGGKVGGFKTWREALPVDQMGGKNWTMSPNYHPPIDIIFSEEK